ncbi:hypothetical protein KKA15_06240 [Patescibacteria group bacterium]|nr:hypothetical protein [Patescibacteria group bacterium]
MKQVKNIFDDGILQCARYAYMPNRLRYCGGDKNFDLFEYVTNQQTDEGLKEILHDFATLDPYLKLIAQSSNIKDQFDKKVIEAYWIGNDLLDKVKVSKLYRHLVDEHDMKKKLKPEIWQQVEVVLPAGAKPHHSFHVFNIPKRSGNYPVEHTISTMDECRISWGKIIKGPKAQKITVKYQPLVYQNNQFALGEEIEKEVLYQNEDKSFVSDLEVGDTIAMHWSWVCEKLNPQQVNNLNKWTNYHISLKNLEYA